MALFETQGKQVEATLAEIGAEGGGWFLPEDAAQVRDEAERLLLRASGQWTSCSASTETLQQPGGKFW